jgi:hypothetical protein
MRGSFASLSEHPFLSCAFAHEHPSSGAFFSLSLHSLPYASYLLNLSLSLRVHIYVDDATYVLYPTTRNNTREKEEFNTSFHLLTC